jgi:hypothetical protein
VVQVDERPFLLPQRSASSLFSPLLNHSAPSTITHSSWTPMAALVRWTFSRSSLYQVSKPLLHRQCLDHLVSSFLSHVPGLPWLGEQVSRWESWWGVCKTAPVARPPARPHTFKAGSCDSMSRYRKGNSSYFFLNRFIVVLGKHCDIYKSVYNIS